MKFTKDEIAKLRLADDEDERFWWADDMPKLGIRGRRNGKRRRVTLKYVFQYRVGKQQRRKVIGSVGVTPISDVKAAAVELDAKVALGQDPVAGMHSKRAHAHETIGKMLTPYLAHVRPGLAPNTIPEVERYLLAHAKPLHSLPVGGNVNDLRRTIAALVTAVKENSGPGAAQKLRGNLYKFFAWCVGEGLCDTNPVEGIPIPIGNASRERVLSPAELRSIWLASVAMGDYGEIVRLCMLLGARREEIGGLRTSEVDLDRALITLPAERVKNRREFLLPLSAPAVAILRSRTQREGKPQVFGRGASAWANWSHPKADLDDAARVTGWVLHDLRRTMATMMGDELSVPPHIIECCLNHQTFRRGAAKPYHRGRYLNEMRQALDLWADWLMAAVEDRDSNVAPLRRAN